MKPSSAANKVTIIQPYVPTYRVPLFETLHDLLAQDNLQLQVAHPSPSHGQAARNDSASGEWSVPIRSHSVQVGRKTICLRNSSQFLAESALIVAELASTNLDTYRLLMQRRTPVALWGHGKAYVTPANRIDTWLETRMCQRAVHAIVYTESGAKHLEGQGIPRQKITIAWNSTDTESLRVASASLSVDDIREFQTKLSLMGSNTAVFVGALDESKRLDLLLDAIPMIQAELPDFQLVIAGKGPLQRFVEERAASNAAIRVVPHADRRTLALLGKVGKVCLVPGRVGLVAVDAMTLGLPLITTDWRYHAPEHEYLQPTFSVIAAQSASAFAAATVSMLSRVDEHGALSAAAEKASHRFSITAMARHLHSAILRSLIRGTA